MSGKRLIMATFALGKFVRPLWVGEERRASGLKPYPGLTSGVRSPGIENLQPCSVAVREQGTLPQNVDPGVKVVSNAWISLIAYQNRGYAYIAP